MALIEQTVLTCLFFLLSTQLHQLCSAQCETAGRFGKNCQHQCNCRSQCNTTGACITSCNESFEGPTCQKENAALRKTATATSRHSGSWTADKAVDGDTRQDVFTGTCFLSAESHPSNEWSVDLGTVFPMDNIVIYYNKRFTSRFYNAKIEVANVTGSGTLCATVKSADKDSNAVFRYSCSTSGSKLVIRHDSPCGECILEFCEVQVFVCTEGFQGKYCNESCRAGWYGRGCLSQCGNCSEGTACRDTDGICPQGCLPGWRGDQCKQVCPNATYGQNCRHECGNCLDGANCHHVTGSCPNGSCQPGYKGDKCNDRETERELPPGSQTVTQGPSCTEGLGVGVAIGVAVCLAVCGVILALYCFVRRHRRRRGPTESSGPSGQRGSTRGTADSVHYNAAVRPAEDEAGKQYETLDSRTRNANVPDDYEPIRSKDG